MNPGVVERWRRLPPVSKWGWGLYLASMATPSVDLTSVGAYWIVLLPRAAFAVFARHQGHPWLAAGALIGVATNLFALVRIPWPVCLAAVFVPFLAYLSVNSGDWAGIGRGLIALPFFYPWAAGLVLINAGRALPPRQETRASMPA